MSVSKDFDVVVYGATGFTGRLVADYLARHYGGTDVRWAMAGRSADKLAAVREEIAAPDDTPLIVADATDEASLKAMTDRAACVLTTVGPYQLYGNELLETCIRTGTDYVDLCGEPAWMREKILAHEEQARNRGARITFSCGFDSIPFDLGVWYLQNHLLREKGAPASYVRGRVRDMKGTFSGGTVASFKATMAAAFKDPETVAVLKNDYSLVPGFNGPQPPEGHKVEFEEDLNSWSAPFIMAAINVKNIHRSNALMDHGYGLDFTYTEKILTGPGDKGEELAKGIANDSSMMSDEAPKPGEGPSKEERENGRYDVMFVAGQGADLSIASVKGDMDPGYGSTSKMISEAALCLVRDMPDLPGGIYTPAPSMGSKLVDRLQKNAGLTFAIEKG